MGNNSDYKKTRTNLFDLLPEVYRSDTNKSVLENVFNRYLTKPEIRQVSGYAGEGNPNAVIQRQIPEPTPHRQAFQLQPSLYVKVGTVEHIASYENILNELTRLGIDLDRLPLWGNAEAFNFIPPIDIDKLIHYSDYYWYDPDNPGSRAEYITMKNACTFTEGRVHQYQVALDQYGEEHLIKHITAGTNGQFYINGDVTELFTSGFAFYIRTAALNPEINNSWFTTTVAEFDTDINQTIITVQQTITNDTLSGIISLIEYRTALEAERDCSCYGNVGWDNAQWDDNQVGEVLWTVADPDGPGPGLSLLDTITTPTPNPTPDVWDLWYDTSVDKLYQWDGNDWLVVQHNFSVILAVTQGTHYWDLSLSCDSALTNPWTDANKWVHKNHVPNFSIAKPAAMPIIEYDPRLELNEWTVVDFEWKYRETKFHDWEETTAQPSRHEIIQIDNFTIDPSLTEFTIDSSYGDFTQVIKPGYVFRVLDSTDNDGDYEVISSIYKKSITGDFETIVTISNPFVSDTSDGSINPTKTTQGHNWRDYHEHWLYVGTTETLPVNHQPENPFTDLSDVSFVLHISGDYKYKLNKQAQSYEIIANAGVSDFPLDTSLWGRALGGADDVRVYVDGVRQYGNYDEVVDGANQVTDISLYTPAPKFSTVTIIVGPSTFEDIGFENVEVRHIGNAESEADFITNGTTKLSLVHYRKVEQVKTATNQYPLFDMYYVDGTPAYMVSPLFAYREDSTYPINTVIGKRVVEIDGGREYEFEQYLVEEDDGRMFAFRDYALQEGLYWYDPENQSVHIWNNDTWAEKMFVGDYYTPAVVSEEEPTDPELLIEGMLWYDLLEDKLMRYDGVDWFMTPFTPQAVDPTLRTIWRQGTSDNEYIPKYVNADKEEVPVGDPLGSWEIPDQWYHNISHENRRIIKLSELLTHFNTIIDSQVQEPGFIGTPRGLFHLLSDVNFSVGGTIKEHNDSYDTFISSTFVNNITPISLIEFAQNQYENSLNTIKEFFRRDVVTYFTNPDAEYIAELSKIIAEEIITRYEQNDATALVYGDSTVYHDGVGIRNWIATLPFLRLAYKYKPELVTDHDMGINELIHHDGHRSQVGFPLATLENIIQRVLNTPDNRFGSGATIGMQSSALPPSTVSQLLTAFGATRVQEGLYWYHIDSGIKTLYRFNVTQVDTNPPATVVPNGSLWLDTSGGTGNYILKRKDGLSWIPVTGLPNDIAAGWQVININTVLGEVLLEVENRLYDAAPENDGLAFDFESVTSETITYNQYLQEEFNQYIHERDIERPYSNVEVYDGADPFTWNYKYSSISLYPSSVNVGTESGGVWQDLYYKLYNTPYPHLEPWKLQGYTDKPEWWDEEYKDLTGARRWIYNHATTTGMWENIRTGVIPAGRIAPNGRTIGTGVPLAGIPTYNYMSVNIDETLSITIGSRVIEVDGLLPPYWNHTPTHGPAYTGPVRTVFTNINNVINSGFDYLYGDRGLNEWKWNISSERLYDELAVAFRMQPIRFIQQTFGEDFVTIAGLQINTRTENVFSHFDTLFHGDVINTNETFSVDGINQWYVNSARYSELDISLSDFRRVWSNWTAPLSYQFASIIDTQTLYAANRNFDIVTRDYSIKLKRFPGFEDYWVDSFKVTLLQAPPDVKSYDNQNEWKLQVDTCSPIGRTFEYYGVQNYEFNVDKTTDIATLYSYTIKVVNTTNNEIVIDGDKTEYFQPGTIVEIVGSTGNDGDWEIQNVFYNVNTKDTHITMVDTLPSVIPDGNIISFFRSLPWVVGDEVVVNASRVLPVPLINDANETYYIIPVASNQFKLAETYENAIANIAIDFISTGVGDLTVGKLKTTFLADQGKNTTKVWKHYAVDKETVLSFSPPTNINGMQTLINLVDGYVAYVEDQGFVFNYESVETDEITGRVITWQSELENVISSFYGIRRTKFNEPNYYDFTVDDINNEITFAEHIPNWSTGLKVRITLISDGASMPAPLIEQMPYYIIRDGNTFQLAATLHDARQGNAIDFTSVGSGVMALHIHTDRNLFPTYTINPFRNSLWFNNKQGIISNIDTGPYTDIRTEQTVYDKNGDPINPNELIILREDKLGQLRMLPDTGKEMCGAHLFVDGYEHVMLFNNYSTEGFLIYDPFVGLNTSKFELEFFRQAGDTENTFTLRPNIGGYVLHDNNLVQNIEGSVDELRNIYDTFTVLESKDNIKRSRSTLGYLGVKDYMNQLSVGPKSQFIYWRGMIQSKGSVNSIKAFINSRRFVDAKIDEYWAYNIASYGDSGREEFPEIKLYTEDAAGSDLRLEFVATNGTPEEKFDPVYPIDPYRWYREPEQQINVDTNLYFDAEVTSVMELTDETGAWNSEIDFRDDGNVRIFITDTPCDAVVITWDDSKATQWDHIQLSDIGPITGTSPTGLALLTNYSMTVNLENDGIYTVTVNGSYAQTIDELVEQINFDLLTGYAWFDETDETIRIRAGVLAEPETSASVIITDVNLLSSLTMTAIVNTTTFDDLTSRILEDGVDFSQINSRVIKLWNYNALPPHPTMKVYALNPAKSKLSPAKLVDTKANTTVLDVPLWDPARGHHFPLSTKVIDLYNDQDPATYTYSRNMSIISDNAWNATEKGVVWADMSNASYVPYYDARLINTDTRLLKWGKLTDWADIKLYQWTKSSVPPEEYNSSAAEQEGDLSISEEEKLTGQAKGTIYRRERDHVEMVPAPQTSGEQVIDLTTLYGITSESDPTGLIDSFQLNWNYTGGSTTFSTGGREFYPSDLTVTVNGNPATFTPVGAGPTHTQFTVTSALTNGDIVIAYGASPTYTTRITVDGTEYTITVSGETAQTFGELLTGIRDDLSGATIELDSNSIVVTSEASGSSSSIKIVDNPVGPWDIPLFQNLVNYSSHNENVIGFGIDGTLTSITPHPFTTGDEVLASSDDVLPTPLDVETNYTVEVIDAYTIKLKDEFSNNVAIQDVGTGTHTIAKVEWSPIWSQEKTIAKEIHPELDPGVAIPGATEYTLPSEFNGASTIDVYVNGTFVQERPMDANNKIELDASVPYNPEDILTVVKVAHEPSAEELSFDPDTKDDGTVHIQYIEDFDYTTVERVLSDNTIETTYYFWVGGKTTHKDSRTLSLREAEQQMITIPTPFILYQKFNRSYDIDSNSSGTASIIVPHRYTQMVCRGLSDLLNDENRYVMRLTQNFTLRDDLNDGESALDLKTTHKEWRMFRQEQQFHIDRYLWNKVTESIIGYQLNGNADYDSTSPVPALDRVLYDETYETDTRYGMKEGQAFVDGELALASIIAYLEDPNNDFYPVDITEFFEHHSFDTIENAIAAMDTIYNSFANLHVNRMFFSVLMDALSLRTKYPDIMKTSMVALHGIRILETAGIFDD